MTEAQDNHTCDGFALVFRQEKRSAISFTIEAHHILVMFFINNKKHYEDVMRLYSEGDRAALFLAEYEGKAIAGMIVLRLGHWSWYMFGASSNEQRNLMPNHLLQWTAMQWARSHGCWYYNFRGIPEVLEEGEELWGVYVFKRGFGGYALRFLETHDLVYQPVVYKLYMRLLEVKRRRDEKARKMIQLQRQREEAK